MFSETLDQSTTTRSRSTNSTRTHDPRVGERTGNKIVTDLEVNVDRREDEFLRTRDELEAAVALHEPGHVGEPPGIDVKILVQLPRKTKE